MNRHRRRRTATASLRRPTQPGHGRAGAAALCRYRRACIDCVRQLSPILRARRSHARTPYLRPRAAVRQIDKKETTIGRGAVHRLLVLAVGRTCVRRARVVRRRAGGAIDCIDPAKTTPRRHAPSGHAVNSGGGGHRAIEGTSSSSPPAPSRHDASRVANFAPDDG